MMQRPKEPLTADELARWGIRGIDAFTAEELVLLQQKLEEWIRQRGPPAGGKRRRQPFILKPRPSPPR